MKVAGIIAEYNPFHNGHAYHIEQVRKKSGAEYIIVIMSGNFVQRGTPAIVDKHVRARMALLGGADLVIELPVVAATASAESFARAGVSILNSTGVVTHLGFGCETDNLELLELLAELFVEEPAEYKEFLGTYLREGKTFPEARAAAANSYIQMQQKNAYSCDNVYEILNNPNNILAIEYLKAIRYFNVNMQPCPIIRQGNHYHEQELSEHKMASATAIRQNMHQVLADNDYATQMFSSHIPKECAGILTEHLNHTPPVSTSDFSNLLLYKLHLERSEFTDYLDVKRELANRILNMRERFTDYEAFVELLKTKNITYTSVCRGLLHILLDIKDTDLRALTNEAYAPYIRILGFRKIASALLKEINLNSEKVITKLAQDKYLLSGEAQKLLYLDINSTHIYNSIVFDKSSSEFPKNEFRTPLVFLD